MQASFPCCAQLDIKMRARKGICVQIMEKVNNALIWTELATKNFEKLLAGTPSASQHTQEVRRNCSTNMHAWNECAVLRTKSTRDHAHVYARQHTIVLCCIYARQFCLTPKYRCYRFCLPVCYYHATHLIFGGVQINELKEYHAKFESVWSELNGYFSQVKPLSVHI